jgi:hypothetical protein
MDRLIDLALAGVARLGEIQSEALAATLSEVDSVLRKGDRRPAAPKDERDLWGKP